LIPRFLNGVERAPKGAVKEWGAGVNDLSVNDAPMEFSMRKFARHFVRNSKINFRAPFGWRRKRALRTLNNFIELLIYIRAHAFASNLRLYRGRNRRKFRTSGNHSGRFSGLAKAPRGIAWLVANAGI
jgi:hypothetical protein